MPLNSSEDDNWVKEENEPNCYRRRIRGSKYIDIKFKPNHRYGEILIQKEKWGLYGFWPKIFIIGATSIPALFISY